MRHPATAETSDAPEAQYNGATAARGLPQALDSNFCFGSCLKPCRNCQAASAPLSTPAPCRTYGNLRIGPLRRLSHDRSNKTARKCANQQRSEWSWRNVVKIEEEICCFFFKRGDFDQKRARSIPTWTILSCSMAHMLTRKRAADAHMPTICRPPGTGARSNPRWDAAFSKPAPTPAPSKRLSPGSPKSIVTVARFGTRRPSLRIRLSGSPTGSRASVTRGPTAAADRRLPVGMSHRGRSTAVSFQDGGGAPRRRASATPHNQPRLRSATTKKRSGTKKAGTLDDARPPACRAGPPRSGGAPAVRRGAVPPRRTLCDVRPLAIGPATAYIGCSRSWVARQDNIPRGRTIPMGAVPVLARGLWHTAPTY